MATLTGWRVITLPVPAPGEVALLVGALRALGALQVERDGDRLTCLFPAPAHVPELEGAVRSAVRANTSIAEPEISSRPDDGGGWAERWRRDFVPRRVTDRIRVEAAEAADPGVAAGRSPGAGAGAVTVRLLPGLGFGTADHPTTRSSLRLLDRLLAPRERLADVGAGSGILSIAAALLGARRVEAYELDASACAAARANVTANGVTDRVRVRHERVGPRTLGWLPRYQGIMANIAAGALVPLLPGLRRALAPGGWLILSGISLADRDRMLKAAGLARLETLAGDTEDGWWTGSFRRPPRRRWRLRE